MLTDIEIRNAKPKAKPYKMRDANGLYVLVAPSGRKTFRYRYELPPGKESTIVLGEYPAMSLAEARKARDEARALVKQGVNPSGHRKAQKEAALEAARAKEEAKARATANTFQAVALDWMERQGERWRPSHAHSMRRTMERNVFPEIGDRPIDQLTKPDVVKLLQAIEERGAPAIAAKALQGIRGACRYAEQTGRVSISVAENMRGVLKSRKEEHHKAMPLEDMPGFLQALRDSERIHPITKAATLLTILCATRTSETIKATWNEIDMDKSLWSIPAERMKAGLPHVIPLPRQAVRILKDMENHRRKNNPYIFPGIRTQSIGKPISGNTMLYGALYRLGYHGKATVHGFRSLFTDVANESVKGFDKDAIERALSHQERNRVRAAYHRTIYLEERRTMLQWWADWLEAMEQTGTVPPPENYLPQDFHQGR